jgi:hypothetical protein
MKAKDIHSTDPKVRGIFYDIFRCDNDFGKSEAHREANIELLCHYLPTMDKETQRRARWTLRQLGL